MTYTLSYLVKQTKTSKHTINKYIRQGVLPFTEHSFSSKRLKIFVSDLKIEEISEIIKKQKKANYALSGRKTKKI